MKNSLKYAIIVMQTIRFVNPKTGGIKVLKLDEILSAAETVAKEYPITRINLFGSYAEGRNTADSDVDLLVEFETEAVSLITLSSLKNRLEELLDTPVDVIHAPIPEGSILEIGKVVPLYAA